MTIAERIRVTRQQQKLSQAELAQRSGVNKKSLSRYELDNSIPPVDALKAIADVLGVSTNYLLSGETVQIKDKELLKKFEVIQAIDEDTKKIVDNFLDLIIRDFKAREVYAG